MTLASLTIARPYNGGMELIKIGRPPAGNAQSGGETQIDPVCGMSVEPASAAGSFDYQGRTYYFCARSCLERFRADPEAYLGQPGGDVTGRLTPPARQLLGAKHTCP